MSLEILTQRILSDAEAEAEAIVALAQKRADETVERARSEVKARRAQEEEEMARTVNAMEELGAATARLEAKRISLGERRRVLDTVYARALSALESLPEKEYLALLSRLLDEYAEEGDEVLLAKNCPFMLRAGELVTRKKLKLSKECAAIRGGFYLRGVRCDRNVSFEALLERDREEHQAELAKKLFKTL